MKLKFVGTGSAFTMKNFQSNFLVEQNGRNLLIDAGSDIRFSLAKMGLSYKDIDAVYISHLHADHAGGLEYLAFCTYFDPSVTDKIELIGNNEVIRDLWNSTLKGGLRSIQTKHMTLDEYFDVQMIRRNHAFEWEDIHFQIVQSIHIVDEFSIVPSFGLLMRDLKTDIRVYFTSDSQFAPNQIMDYYRLADVIIQDCETTPFKSGVHANFMDLETLPADVKQKMYLMHYQDNVLDDNNVISTEWYEKADKAGFKGFLNCGQIIEF